MVDIQSAAAEIRRGKKKERRNKETTEQKYNDLPYSIWQAIIKPAKLYSALQYSSPRRSGMARVKRWNEQCLPLRTVSPHFDISPRVGG